MPVSNDAKSIFLAAVEKPPTERDAFLSEACGGDDVLRHRVEALLGAYGDPQSRLDRPLVERAAAGELPTAPLPEITERAGTVVGPYKLLEQIGEGGFGVVYLAEQTEPVRRRVALKIIKPGMDSRQVIARFEAERQALAMMDHQNIARVLDAGTTDTGRPYFVMELVKGVPITEYCDANKLTVRERLELFIPVCQAIQHAHQKGIIHRDVKPSNVLVCLYDGKPVPKVIDFGVAKAIEQRLTEKTMFTQHGQVIGTLEYMSPEQAELSQLDVDTRSDIYSLGVLLYELLTGTTPITKEQLRSAGYAEMLSLIRECEPEAPSTRLSHSQKMLPTLSAQRRTEPARLGALVRGELDWIVMKSLEKDRTRRYESASALARDVERHLEDEPVEACPPSMAYKVRKLVRKHRAALTTAAVVAAILVVASVVSTWQAIRATRAEVIARENAEEARSNERRWLDAARQATLERDRARVAEDRAQQDRSRAVAATSDALRELGRSLYHRARALLASDLPGRRWAALEALQKASRLGETQPGDLAAAADAGVSETGDRANEPSPFDRLAGETPSQAHLRSEAVAALLLNDAHVVREWGGAAHSVSPGGRFAASLYADLEQNSGGIVIMNLMTGAEVARWEGDEAEPLAGMAIALGPDARRLASVSNDRRGVNVWMLPEKKAVARLTVPDELTATNAEVSEAGPGLSTPFTAAQSLTFSPDGRYVAGVFLQQLTTRVILWSLQDPQAGRVVGSGTHGHGVTSFSPDSRLLAFTAEDGLVTLWNVKEGRIETRLELPLKPSGSVGFAPAGNLAIHCYGQNESTNRLDTERAVLLLWDVEHNQELARVETAEGPAFTGIAVAPDGNHAAMAGIGGNIQVVGLHKQESPAPLRLDHGALTQHVAWTADGRHLLSSGVGAVKVWEFAEDVPLKTQRLVGSGDGEQLIALAYSPNGDLVAAHLEHAQVTLFDATTGHRIRHLEGNSSSSLFELKFSPDGQYLVRVGLEELNAWDAASGEESSAIASAPFNGRKARSIGFRADGSILAAGLEQFQPVVWNVPTGEVVWQRSRKPGSMAVISPDAQLAAAFSAFPMGGKTGIQLWDLSSERERFALAGAPRKGMQTLAEFSPDGRWLLALHMRTAAGAGLHAVTHSFGPDAARNLVSRTSDEPWIGDIWDLSTGERHMQFGPLAQSASTHLSVGVRPNGTTSPLAYTFSPNGRYLALSLSDGALQLWEIEGKQELFEWRPAFFSGRQPVTFTADSMKLVVADPSRPVLHLLDLDQLNEQLAELGLGW